MLFFNSQCIILKEFLPEGTVMNAAMHMEILTCFLKRLRRVWPHYTHQGLGFLVHDNAFPHTANIFEQFLTKRGGVQIEHPPYSTDLNPPDFFLFLGVKLAEKGKIFDDIPDIQ
ncbi:mariner Mos1 transposase [Trichonephila clavipes]|nr:mariner Mos1 transposase [Trichonephila clavipes]